MPWLIAFIHNVRIVNAFSRDQSSEAIAAESAAQRAVTLDGNDATILMHYGLVLAQSLGRYDDGVALLDKALDLDPNLAAAWTFRGMFKGGQGKIDEAISDLEHALRLSPRDPWQMGGRTRPRLGELDGRPTTTRRHRGPYGPCRRGPAWPIPSAS